MNREKLIKYIKINLDNRTLLEQLAEEGSELSQAALKLIRALRTNNNPTLAKPEDAIENVKEELKDVLLVAEMLHLLDDINDFEDLQEATKGKLERWANRIAGKGDTPKGETRIERIESCREGTVKRCVRCGYNMPEKLFPYYCPGCGCKIMYVSDDFLKSKR